MTTTLALDIGTKRIGVAISDELGLIASPAQALSRAQSRAEAALKKLISSRKIKRLVVGMPYGENGEHNQQCKDIENFCRRLLRRVEIELIFVDEYLSSVEAKDRLKSSGKLSKVSRGSGVIDSNSAAIILQQFLDSKK